MTISPRHGKMRITLDADHFHKRLREAGWDKRQITLAMERMVFLAEEGEDYIDVLRRLNPPAIVLSNRELHARAIPELAR